MAFEGTIQEFTVSMHGNTLEYPFIEVQQGDTASRSVRIHLKTFGGADFLIPYGATAVLSVDKTDGHKVLNECEIEDSSTVIITLTSQTLACPGKQLSQIYIFTDKGDIKTQKFYINVPKAVYDDDAVESADEYGILHELIASIEAMDDGVTFTPHVSEDGTLTWSNDGGLDNPEPMNIMGPEGPEGPKGNNGAVGERGTGILKVLTMPQEYTTPIGDYEPQYRKSISEIIEQTGVSEVLIGDIIEFSWYHYIINYLDDEYAYISRTKTSIRGPQGQKGDPGEKGSDASVTKENISSALGYTPANEEEVSRVKSDLNEKQPKGNYALEEDLKDYLPIEQGSQYVGKILVVGADGKLSLTEMPSGGSVEYDVIGVVEEDNVITLTSDDLPDGTYTLRFLNAEEYTEIGTLVKGEPPEEDTTVYPPKGELFVASTCAINSRIKSDGSVASQNSTFVTDYILIGDLAVGETRDIYFSGFQIQMNRANPYTKIEVYDADKNRLGQATEPVNQNAIVNGTSGLGTYKATVNNPSSTTKARYIRVVGHLGEDYATLGSNAIGSTADLSGCSIIISL